MVYILQKKDFFSGQTHTRVSKIMKNGSTQTGPDASFKRAHRIKKKKDFEKIFERRTLFRGQTFTAYVLPTSLDFSRVGLVTSRKVGNAVRRNRIRRLLRECFRLNKALLGPGLDVVLVTKKNFPTTFKEAEEEFKRFAGWCNQRRSR